MFFDNPVLFEVAVLPRVQKFIRTKLTDEAGQQHPMLVDPSALGPGLMLWAMAQSEKVHLFTNWDGERSKTRRFDPAPLTGRIGVGIQEFHPSRHQYLLNAAEQWVFTNMVTYMIRNELVQYCEAEPGVPPIQRIKAFCDHYDFSEQDFTEQALRQMYLRHRKQVGAHGFSVHVNQNFTFVPMRLAA
jgi:hypothetical protein